MSHANGYYLLMVLCATISIMECGAIAQDPMWEKAPNGAFLAVFEFLILLVSMTEVAMTGILTLQMLCLITIIGLYIQHCSSTAYPIATSSPYLQTQNNQPHPFTSSDALTPPMHAPLTTNPSIHISQTFSKIKLIMQSKERLHSLYQPPPIFPASSTTLSFSPPPTLPTSLSTFR